MSDHLTSTEVCFSSLLLFLLLIKKYTVVDTVEINKKNNKSVIIL